MISKLKNAVRPVCDEIADMWATDRKGGVWVGFGAVLLLAAFVWTASGLPSVKVEYVLAVVGVLTLGVWLGLRVGERRR